MLQLKRGPRKMLAVFANPRRTSRLALDEEQRTIERCLQIAKRPFGLTVCAAARPGDLQQKLIQHAPEIVHISAHGTADGLVFVDDDTRDPQTISPAALCELLAAHGVRIVVLNACYSSVHADELAKWNVPYVIVMSDQIRDQAAIGFTHGFYTALGAGRDVPLAFADGVRAMKLMDATETQIPRIWVNEGAPGPTPRRVRQMLVATALAVFVLATLYLYARPTMTFDDVTPDHERLRFTITEHWPNPLRIDGFQVTKRDPELGHMQFGEFLPSAVSADGILEVGIDAMVAEESKLSQVAEKKLWLEAKAVDPATNIEFLLAAEVPVGKIIKFVRKRGSPEGLVVIQQGMR